MIGKTIRQYRILGELKPGKGGMGDLFLAEHVNLPRRFVIKCIKPGLGQDAQFRKRFIQEASDQASLNHANIVQAIDFFEEGSRYFLVMHFVDGQDLDSLIKSEGPLVEERAVSILGGVLQGLAYSHARGIVHRDIKPSNVLIEQDGRACITDFGIAILAGSERLTATGTGLGTPCYMSPEQIRDPRSVDHRSDIYSAGILLFEMLTGQVPFDGESEFAIKEKQCHAPVPNPRMINPAISDALARIVLKALGKRPLDRFQNCEEFLLALKELGDRPTPSGEASHPSPASVPGNRRRIWVGIGVLGVLVLGSGLLWKSDSLQRISPRKLPDGSISQGALSLEDLKGRAEAGDGAAQYELGTLYDEGKGVPHDPVTAAAWYRKSAEQGNPKAQTGLGNLYYNGEGMPADPRQAYWWHRKAAVQGYADAQNYLGEMLVLGEGVKRDEAEGAEWIRKAAEQGFPRAQKNLGDLYMSGKGVEANLATALMWYQRASDRGDEEAKAVLKQRAAQ